MALSLVVPWMLIIGCATTAMGQSRQEIPRWEDLPAPVVEGRWVRPAAAESAQPMWGHADGLRIALHPSPGPRGLLRVYAPYLLHREERQVNFIAVEPIVAGENHRGYSELEPSRLDGVKGKRFWSVNDPSDRTPRQSWHPARGKLFRIDGVGALRVYVMVEPFDNGAKVCLRLTFRADRPYEVGIATAALDDSKPLDRCIITATMGNYARLRELHLANRVVRSTELWPDYTGDAFIPHASFALPEMIRLANGDALVTCTPDETSPEQATYTPGTRPHWRYTGIVGTQYWRCEKPPADLRAQVNGRYTYWASRSPIPGGISFENFELVAPFTQGQEFWFGVVPGIQAAAGGLKQTDPHRVVHWEPRRPNP